MSAVLAKSQSAVQAKPLASIAHDLSCVNGTELGGGLDALNSALNLTHAPEFRSLVAGAKVQIQKAKNKMEGLICDLELAVSSPPEKPEVIPAGAPSDDGVSSPTPRTGDAAFARVMWRLQMASCKLDLAATHWKGPAEVSTEDLGAVMTVHEVAHELDGLYCAFSELIHEHGLWVGPWVDNFDEGAPEPVFFSG